MASQSGNIPPLDGEDGGGVNAVWANPGNALTCDNVYSTAGPLAEDARSNNLQTTNYDISALNPSAHLTGIEVHIEAVVDQGEAQFRTVTLFRRNVSAGDDKSGLTLINTVESDFQFGGPGDLWNSSFKTVADFGDPNTGVSMTVREVVQPAPTVSVDCITLICYFNETRPFIMRFALRPSRATLPRNHNHRSRT